MLVLSLGSVVIVVLGWTFASTFSSGPVRVNRMATTPLVCVTIVLATVPPLMSFGGEAETAASFLWLVGSILAIPAVSFVGVSLTRIKELAELGDQTMRSIGRFDVPATKDLERIGARLEGELHRLKGGS